MNDDLNEDWIKTLSWDMPYDDLAGFWTYNGVSRDSVVVQKSLLRRFMALPAWGAAPEQLKAEAGAWLLRN